MKKELITHSFNETMELGKLFATKLPSGSTLCMSGDLGAGKTTFVRGLAQGLNIKEVVQSPTFNIMKIYLKASRPLIHIDAYRLADFMDEDIGLDEYIGYETGITVIEWPIYLDNRLIPDNAISIEINRLDDSSRRITITTNNEDFLGELSL